LNVTLVSMAFNISLSSGTAEPNTKLIPLQKISHGLDEGNVPPAPSRG
jgi:hypothetical protein